MYSDDSSLADSVLNYLYFNNCCSMQELEENVVIPPDSNSTELLWWILKLELQRLVTRKKNIVELNTEGFYALEQFSSYLMYVNSKNCRTPL